MWRQHDSGSSSCRTLTAMIVELPVVNTADIDCCTVVLCCAHLLPLTSFFCELLCDFVSKPKIEFIAEAS